MTEKELFDLIVDMGQTLMVNGGEISRAEETMERAAKSFGIEGFASFVIANGIMASAVVGGETYTCKIVNLAIASPYMNRVVGINQLSREISAGLCSPEQARRRLDAIRVMEEHPRPVKVLFSGAGAAAFCFLFGGCLTDSLIAFGAGILGALYLFFAVPKTNMSKIIVYITASALVTLYTLLMFRLGLAQSINLTLIGAIFPFVPGMPFTNGIRYLFDDDYLSGVIQILHAFLLGASLAIGVGVTLALLGAAAGVPV